MANFEEQFEVDLDAVPGERYDITEGIFQRDFVDKWRASIRSALRGMDLDVSSIKLLRGAEIDTQGVVDPDEIWGAFNDQGQWIEPSPDSIVLRKTPVTVLDVRLTTGKMLRVVLTAPNDSVASTPNHFLALKMTE